MMRQLRIFIAFLLALGISGLLAGCGSGDSHVVAKVGNMKITAEEIDNYFNRIDARFPSFDREYEEKRRLLDSLINQRLLIIGAYEKGLENHDDVLTVMEGEKHKFLLDVMFEKEIIDKAMPSEAEIRDWYDRSAEELHAAHIVVDSLSTAQEVLKKLKEGENFEKLALEYSIDPTVKRNQGDLDWFVWGMYVDEFQNAAFKLKPGEISAPVKTQYGYHIIKLIDRRPSENRKSFEEAKDQIRDVILERRKRKLMQDYVEKLRAEYPITVEKPTCEFVLKKLATIYPDTIGTRPRWRNNFDLQQLDRDEKNLPIGTYDGGQLTLGEYLTNLPRLPDARRPDFDSYDSLKEVIFQMSLMDILRIEAEKLGYDKSDEYKEKLKRFRELAMADIMRNDTIPASVEINEGEVQEYYDNHKDEFEIPARYHLLEVQFDNLDSAKRYVQRISTEGEFRRTARQRTQRPGKKKVEGDLGFIVHDQYPNLYDAADTLSSGRIGGPVLSGGRYSIFWILEHHEPEVSPYERVKQRIVELITREKGDSLYEDWLADMKKRINIEVYDDVLKDTIDKSKYAGVDSVEKSG
jgi:parvulin-like peptidyl-prolyl isomerase